ncbi:actin-related protein 10-like isoform X2 [Diaphorina citri]|uniref:Actin-related protein 10-like isoform X2 n=1 Tax=Diaphorina citri TaxID=121845 RepID=A0A3Q0JGZ1_DIACI|nr:actin-related protein 10-like isoform X2 [Diaphorina citri]
MESEIKKMSEARKSLKLPVYEGLLAEKTGVVLDIGSKYTKYGIFGSFQPKGFIKSQVKDPHTNKLRNLYEYKDADDLYGLLIEFIRKIFFKYFVTSPKDKRIVVVESVLTPTVWRNTLAKVLFKHYEVLSLLYVPSHLVSLCTLGVNTGLVLDIGYSEATLLPVYEGVPVLCAWKDLSLGGQSVEAHIRSLLIDEIKALENPDPYIVTVEDVENLSDSIIEDIKVCSCFVTTMERSAEIAAKNPDHKYPSGFMYPLKNGKKIPVSGHIRETAFEVLFELDLDMLNIATIILDSLLSVARDMKKPLAENILLTGGTAMTPGLKYRLLQELRTLIESPPYKDKLFIKNFKFHEFPAKENYVAWLGGAIFAATESYNKRAIQKDAYLNNNVIPDWCNLSVNLPSG